MDTVFPFSYPTSTQFYLVLFVATLVVHVLFMNYVLAGSAWLAMAVARGKIRLGKEFKDETTKKPATLESILADWIPSMLSGAITAGVAPLLFVQILYQREFYSANLLLFNRWMSILPVLIIGFYSFYLHRTSWFSRLPVSLRIIGGAFPFFCIFFVAYSWTENHLVSLSGPTEWQVFYSEKRLFFYEPHLVFRLAVWVFGSIPIACLWLAWQVRYRQIQETPLGEHLPKKIAILALFGLAVSTIAAVIYATIKQSDVEAALQPAGQIYFALASVGLLVQILLWIFIFFKDQLSTKVLVTLSVAALSTISGMAVCREVVRLHELGNERITQLIPEHARAFQQQGFWIFATFLVVNIGLSFWCFRLVQKNYVKHESTEH